METVEIRMVRKLIIGLIGLFIIIMGITLHFEYNAGYFWNLNVSIVAGHLLFIVFLIAALRMVFRNDPVITLTSEFIKVRKVTIPWPEITHWQIEKDNDDEYILNVRTSTSDNSTSLSWLEKTPDQIRELIETYKGY